MSLDKTKPLFLTPEGSRRLFGKTQMAGLPVRVSGPHNLTVDSQYNRRIGEFIGDDAFTNEPPQRLTYVTTAYRAHVLQLHGYDPADGVPAEAVTV
jgi:hypothetical protein